MKNTEITNFYLFQENGGSLSLEVYDSLPKLVQNFTNTVKIIRNVKLIAFKSSLTFENAYDAKLAIGHRNERPDDVTILKSTMNLPNYKK
jgi:hypothetical protein